MGSPIAEQSQQIGQAGGGQRRVFASPQVDQRGGAPNGAGGAVVRGRVRGGLVDTRATVAPFHSQQAAIVHAVQQLRAGVA
ncbi:hypothetical protein G6F62_015321 [Rhizopus arrhizus]|nr:hypothetical protein G6F62_015321 [Rhizopus arrhizus]